MKREHRAERVDADEEVEVLRQRQRRRPARAAIDDHDERRRARRVQAADARSGSGGWWPASRPAATGRASPSWRRRRASPRPRAATTYLQRVGAATAGRTPRRRRATGASRQSRRSAVCAVDHRQRAQRDERDPDVDDEHASATPAATSRLRPRRADADLARRGPEADSRPGERDRRERRARRAGRSHVGVGAEVDRVGERARRRGQSNSPSTIERDLQHEVGDDEQRDALARAAVEKPRTLRTAT